MAERMNIPASPECGEWETLLVDALDGLLSPENQASFQAHQAACPACAALLEEVRRGRQWLEFLSPEPEVPAGLLDRILAQTGPGNQPDDPSEWAGSALPVPAAAGAVPAFVPPAWQQPGFVARMRYAAQARFLMTAAMAFFSIALTLNITGFTLATVHVTPLRLADLRPRTMQAYVERQFSMASVPIVRYYDHLRFVYEVEARVRELRGEVDDDGNGGDQKQEQPKPGETRRNPRSIDGGLRADPQQAAEPAAGPAPEPAPEPADDLLESSLAPLTDCTTHPMTEPATTVDAARQPCERSTVWIAPIIAV
jgi:Putative zinc-finger